MTILECINNIDYLESEIARIEALTDEEYAKEAGCSVMCPYAWGIGKSEREVTLFNLRQDLEYAKGVKEEYDSEGEREDYYLDPAFHSAESLYSQFI